MMAINGRIQRDGEVVHLIAQQLFDLSGDLSALADRDGEFKLPTGRGDEFAHGSPGSPDSRDRAPAVKPRDTGHQYQAKIMLFGKRLRMSGKRSFSLHALVALDGHVFNGLDRNAKCPPPEAKSAVSFGNCDVTRSSRLKAA
ncbi:hypothetical protein U5G49_006267 (plasmid) [Rhizobium indigoferae]|uniref:Uncharacterized protein n=1 Tax=Rhizobium indigoferae TaxID=158891 RepID=A0ABZ1DUV1_9HYPH|nr:hypothetical protein [Rhizobium indigoferae]WRW39212.1 hypothetical protein U5G49_006267 [Rhizobium indigoferae]